MTAGSYSFLLPTLPIMLAAGCGSLSSRDPVVTKPHEVTTWPLLEELVGVAQTPSKLTTCRVGQKAVHSCLYGK